MALKELTSISFGAGVQSSAVLIMSNLGLLGCPRADVAIFADTQSEPPWVYETLERMREWSEIPVVTATAGSLIKDVERRHTVGGRFAAIPTFTRGADGSASIMRRQCTREYKIDVVQAEMRRQMGVRPRQWAKGKCKAEALIGISLDEIQRAAPSRDEWVTVRFPLLEAEPPLRRSDCVKLIKDQGLPVPKKSSCTVCPFHSDAYWLDLRDNHPGEWERACRFDEVVRDMSKSGITNPVFLHRGLKPLRETILAKDGQMSLWGAECSGHCGL